MALFITHVVGFLILQEVRSISGFDQIKASLYASGWPPSVVTVSWTSQIKEDVQFNLLYDKSNDNGCPTNTSSGMILASWCRKNSLKSNPHEKFQCDITEAYDKLDIFEEHAYYNLCVIIVANTSSGQRCYSNMLEEDLTAKTKCPAPPNLTVDAGKRNISAKWGCPAGVREFICKNGIAYKVLLTRKINGSDRCVDKPQEKDSEYNAYFTGLEPDKRYNITVCCSLNSGGVVPGYGTCDCNFMGPTSSSYIVTTKEDAPGDHPVLDTCRAVCLKEDMTLDLTYIAPKEASWNGKPTNYTITYRKISSISTMRNITKTFRFDGEITSFTLVGLDTTAKYNIETRLCTHGGCGPAAKSSVGCEICFGLLPTTVMPTPRAPDEWSKLTLGTIIAAPVVLVLLAIPTIYFCYCRKKSKKKRRSLRELNVVVNDGHQYEQPVGQDASDSSNYDELDSLQVTT